MNLIQVLIYSIVFWNIITFSIMMDDKARAERKEYRISEQTLFLLAFLLGGLGIYFGMLLFRHKTQHRSFKILIPLSILINIIQIFFIFKTSLSF